MFTLQQVSPSTGTTPRSLRSDVTRLASMTATWRRLTRKI